MEEGEKIAGLCTGALDTSSLVRSFRAVTRRRSLVLALTIGVWGCGGGHAGRNDAGGDAYGDASTDSGGDDGAAGAVDGAVDRGDAGAARQDALVDASDASSDVAPPCTPCNLQLGALIGGCSGGTAGVSCVVQTSQTNNSDGTTVNVVNQCFANGAKLLTTKISGSVDAGAFVSSTSQRVKDGQTCLTQQTSGVRSTAGLVATDLFLDGAGHIVASVMTNAVAGADGGIVQIQTMTCAGQPAEPYRLCLPPSPPAADAGDADSSDDAGASAMVTCTPGACS